MAPLRTWPASRSTLRSRPSARRALRAVPRAEPDQRIGLFGGSFNPPHAGHRHVAETALKRLGLDQVWWLVTPQNPLKASGVAAAYEARLAAVCALAHGPRMRVSDLEALIGSHCTHDTLSWLRARWPTTHFVWIMGSDSLSGLHRWRRWRALADLAPIAVISRPGALARARLSHAARCLASAYRSPDPARALAVSPTPAWTVLTARLNPASSTAIRARSGRD